MSVWCRRVDAPRALPAAIRGRRVLSLGDLPFSDGLLTADHSARGASLSARSRALPRLRLVQIIHTVPPEQLFGADYPYFSSFTDAARPRRANVGQRVAERQLGGDSLVVELASNDGYLLQYYPRRRPGAGHRSAPGAGAGGARAGCADAGSLLRPRPRRPSSEGGAPTSSTPTTSWRTSRTRTTSSRASPRCSRGRHRCHRGALLRQLIERQFDTIYHEHLCYFSVTAVPLFARHGLCLNASSRCRSMAGPCGCSSARRSQRPAARAAPRSGARLGIAAPGFFAPFAAQVQGVRKRFRGLIGELGRGGVYRGLRCRGQGHHPLELRRIGGDVDCVVDRNIHKQGKYVPGVRLPIRAPGAMLELPDYLLILAWNFKEEIIAQQAVYRERGGRFIVPIPGPSWCRERPRATASPAAAGPSGRSTRCTTSPCTVASWSIPARPPSPSRAATSTSTSARPAASSRTRSTIRRCRATRPTTRRRRLSRRRSWPSCASCGRPEYPSRPARQAAGRDRLRQGRVPRPLMRARRQSRDRDRSRVPAGAHRRSGARPDQFIQDFYSERYAHLTGDYVCCRHTLEHIGPVPDFVAWSGGRWRRGRPSSSSCRTSNGCWSSRRSGTSTTSTAPIYPAHSAACSALWVPTRGWRGSTAINTCDRGGGRRRAAR